MKKILFLAAVTILAAVSCNKLEIDTPTPEGDAFVATIEGADTKTVIEGMMSYWKGTEVIKLLDGSKTKKYGATVTENSSTAIFAAQEATALTGDDYIAVYPGALLGDVSWDGNVSNEARKFWLKGDQTAVLDSYDVETHIAVAHVNAKDKTLNFKNVNALVKVKVPYDNITEVCIYGNSGEVLSGNFNVKYNNGDPIVTTPTGTNIALNTHAKIKASAEKTLEKGKTYYISILPTTFKKGFTVEFVMNGTKYIKKVNSEYKVSRNQIISIEDVTYDTFAAKDGKLYLKVSEEWKQDNARFAAYFYVTDPKKECWVSMTRVKNTADYYECIIPHGYTEVIFVRMNGAATANNWDNKWTQTADLKIEKNIFSINGWGDSDSGGTWSGNAPKVFFFLTPNANWKKDGARFAAYFFGNGEGWHSMSDNDKDGTYEVAVPISKVYPNVIFCRMNGSASTNDWNNKWNQTGDLTIPTDGKNLFTVPNGAWDGSTATWSKKIF